MTEGCCIAITRYEEEAIIKARTAGHPIRGLTMKIVDENRVEVPQGEVGEIAINGLNLFTGYYKQPELTKSAHDDQGFFYTGDLGKLDESGRLIVAGRKKEMIIRGGFNIYPGRGGRADSPHRGRAVRGRGGGAGRQAGREDGGQRGAPVGIRS